MDGLVSNAAMILLSLHPSPASETSAFNKIRAFSSRWAGLFPFRIRTSSCSRSSPLNRTTYFFTEISFAAMIRLRRRIVDKANHQILTNWLKRATSISAGQARDLALLMTVGPHHGYLATPTSQNQLNFIEANVISGGASGTANVWIGGKRVWGPEVTTWEWLGGPEKGVVFWN